MPDAQILGCSTAGEIHGTSVTDDSVSITAVNFEHTTLRGVCTCSEVSPDSRGVGRALVSQLPHEGLAHVFVISNGLTVNGSELVKGMTEINYSLMTLSFLLMTHPQ